MKVFVALGSNLGDRLAHLQAAAKSLAPLSRTPLRKSAVYETAPLDCPPGSPEFLNAVVELTVDDATSPRELLRALQSVEKNLGRKPKAVSNEPRPMDLDLIAFGDSQFRSADLVLPHPRAHQRRFVLQPLCDLSPDLILPGQTRSVRELLVELEGQPLVARATDW
jgi:2-amino-4-hydroxy-6-hydroxymethyldihydropteridine diphosphokinase